MSKVSIHLVTWNGQKYLEDCLNSLYDQTFSDFSLLIIDNGSVDNTLKIIEQQFLGLFKDKIRLIKNKSNMGFAWAHNQAYLWTDSEYVLVLNQDVLLDKDFLQKAVEFLDQNKRVGSLNGKIYRWEFEEIEDLKKSQKTDIIDSLGLKIFKNQRMIETASNEKDQGQYEEAMEIFGPSGCCPVYRREALADVRYKDEIFDNDFFAYKEDVDLAYRLRWRGWQSYFLPSVKAYHTRSAKSQEHVSIRQIIKQRKSKIKLIKYHSYKNHLFVLYKNLSSRNFRYCFLRLFFYELQKFVYVLFFEWSTLRALGEFFRKKGSMKQKRIFIMKNRLVKDEEIRKWYF